MEPALFFNCDACKRVSPPELAQIQFEMGELVTSRLGQQMRTRQREMFLLCSQCSAYAVTFFRQFLAAGGYAGMAAAAAVETESAGPDRAALTG